MAPPKAKIQQVVRSIEQALGIEKSDDGRVAFRSIDVVIQEILAQDPGRGMMPLLSTFMEQQMPLPIVFPFDATGHGTQQFNTLSFGNPYMSQSSQQLYTSSVWAAVETTGRGPKRFSGRISRG
jgi:hypothetical protein